MNYETPVYKTTPQLWRLRGQTILLP